MELQELIDSLSDHVKSLDEREAKGEDVTAEREKAEQQKSALATLAPPSEKQETELEKLRREKSEREQSDLIKSVAGSVIEQIKADESSQKEAVAKQVAEVVKSQYESGGLVDIDAAVKRSLEGNKREGSRFAGQDSDPDHVKALVEAGRIAEASDALKGITVGEDREVKAIEDSKSLGRFMSMAANIKNGVANDAERRFMVKQNQKALAEGTGSAGGFLVPEEWMPDILGLLRATAVVRRSGPRFQPFNKKMNQTSISAGATAYYTAENAKITPSEQTFAEAPLLTPKNLTALVPVSDFLLGDSPEVDDIVRSDLAEVMALREDLSFLQGTGAGGEPVGIRQFVGKTLNPLGTLGAGNGAALTLKQMRTIRAFTRTLNASNPSWVWFFAPQLITALETLTDPDGRFLADTSILQINPDGLTGRFDGIPFLTTTQIAGNLTYGTSTNASYVILANVRELVVGINQEMVIDVSSEATYTTDGGTTWKSAFQENQTLFRAVMRHDIAPRRPSQFIVQEGVLV